MAHFVFTGHVSHQRRETVNHGFRYPLYMLGIDLDLLAQQSLKQGVCGGAWYHPIRVRSSDYVKVEQLNQQKLSLKQRVIFTLAQQLNIALSADDFKVMMLAQPRSIGLYFSPVNFYFCYNQAGQCQYVLAEVSNTPWLKTHFYALDLQHLEPTDKNFHVSPFMDLAMQYHWRIKPADFTEGSAPKLEITINNKRLGEKTTVFNARMQLIGEPLTSKNSLKTLIAFPAISVSILTRIYWQALKLYLKRVPFVPYQASK